MKYTTIEQVLEQPTGKEITPNKYNSHFNTCPGLRQSKQTSTEMKSGTEKKFPVQDEEASAQSIRAKVSGTLATFQHSTRQ